MKSNLQLVEENSTKFPEENKTQINEITLNNFSNEKKENVKINLEPTKHTRISNSGETYNIYKAFDLSQENNIPIPKSMPLLKNYMKGLLGDIVKRKSIEYKNEEERGK